MRSFYMDIAERCAEMSYATRLHVGAVVVKNNNIISFSWNGMPSGWENVCEHKEYMPDDAPQYMTIEEIEEQYPYQEMEFPGDTASEKLMNRRGRRYRLKTRPEVLHAESNALSKLARTHESGDGAAMFVTHAPCMNCAKMIYQAGIKEVYYSEDYRDPSGVDFLRQCDITVEKLD